MSKLILIACIILTCSFCAFSQNAVNQTNIKQALKKQLLEGYCQYSTDGWEAIIGKEEFTEEEFAVSVYLSEKILLANGYKVPTADEFHKRIKLIFGRTMDKKSVKENLYVNFLDKKSKKFSYHPNDGYDYLGTYIIKEKRFIADFNFIPELLDYQKDFPDVASIENTMVTTTKEAKIERWKDMAGKKNDEYNLASLRTHMQQKLIHRNKYLFNDDRASLNWLKDNDAAFLEKLVTEFGYAEDQELVEWLLIEVLDRF